jgi:hypothetical protein
MTWGQYSFPFIPMVDRYKWLEPRHMVNVTDRFTRAGQIPPLADLITARAAQLAGSST